MSLHSRSRVRFVAVVAVLAVSGAACGGGSDGAEPSPSSGTQTPPAEEPDAVPEPSLAATDDVVATTMADDTATTTPSTAAAPSTPVTDESCEFQSATMWGDELDAYFDALAAATSVDIVEVEGELRLFVTDEVVQYIRDVDMIVNTDGGVAEFRAIEAVTTSWEFVDDVLKTSDLVDRRTYIDSTIDGVDVEADEIEGLVGDLWATNPAEGMEFSCSGPTATLPLGDTGERFTITLQPY